MFRDMIQKRRAVDMAHIEVMTCFDKVFQKTLKRVRQHAAIRFLQNVIVRWNAFGRQELQETADALVSPELVSHCWLGSRRAGFLFFHNES